MVLSLAPLASAPRTAHMNPCSVAADWQIAVERGPDWLFVRLESPSSGHHSLVDSLLSQANLADSLWKLLRESHTHRIVLELDSIDCLDDSLIAEISELGSRVQQEGGLIRISGLSKPNLLKLNACRYAAHVPHFASRSDAVGSRRPVLPR